MRVNDLNGALIAAKLAREIGLPFGNLWELTVSRAIARDLETMSFDEVVQIWRMKLGLIGTE